MAKLRKLTIDGARYLWATDVTYAKETDENHILFRAFLDGYKLSPLHIQFAALASPMLNSFLTADINGINLYKPGLARLLIGYGMQNGWQPVDANAPTVFENGNGILQALGFELPKPVAT